MLILKEVIHGMNVVGPVKSRTCCVIRVPADKGADLCRAVLQNYGREPRLSSASMAAFSEEELTPASRGIL